MRFKQIFLFLFIFSCTTHVNNISSKKPFNSKGFAYVYNNFDFNEKNAMDQSFELIATCIDKIYTEDEVWASADCTKKEMKDFLEQMNSNQFKEIEKFFETMPKLSHSISVTNPKTKVKSEVVLEGLASFFA